MLLKLVFLLFTSTAFSQNHEVPPACSGGLGLNWINELQLCSYEQLIELQSRIHQLQNEQIAFSDNLSALRRNAKVDGVNLIQVEVGGIIGASLGTMGVILASPLSLSQSPKKWAYPLITIGMGIVMLSEMQRHSLQLAYPEFIYFQTMIHHLGEEINLRNRIIELSIELKKQK